MRFITEFELKFPYQLSVLETYKVKHQFDIGNLVGEICDWQTEFDEERERFKLEIEAFPMEKWIEFRKRFLAALPDYDNTSRIRLENALHDLESFGKPLGDIITNLK